MFCHYFEAGVAQIGVVLGKPVFLLVGVSKSLAWIVKWKLDTHIFLMSYQVLNLEHGKASNILLKDGATQMPECTT